MQTTNVLMMVRPASFGYNEQTASNNSFQHAAAASDYANIRDKAQAEFDGFVAILRNSGITVIVADDTAEPRKPDAIFPNNWVSFHADGRVFLYPMYAPNRRLERRRDLVDTLTGFVVREVIDLSGYEADNRFLEGTGSMILDRTHRICYACLSPRTERDLLIDYCASIGYEPVVFYATDRKGDAIYHTNVVMAVAETFVVICMDTVRDAAERDCLMASFAATNKAVITISLAQLEQFAGNMLQVRNAEGTTFLVMSEQAYQSLTPEQITAIEAQTAILHAPLHTIETYGGGSARCMLAEVFLPQK